MNFSSFIIISFLLTIISFNANAATLHDDGTYYTHIDNLVVDGTSYTATFVDGTYNQVRATYGDEALNYTYDQAAIFANALYSYLNPIESDLDKVFTGCTGTGTCYLSTTVTLNSLTAWSVNQYSGSIFNVSYWSNHQDPRFNYSTVANVVWSPSAVPLPAALFMFAPALLGFLGFRRRKVQA